MRDFELYYKSMGANVHEKIDFIVDELSTGDYKKVIDIGCADGQVIKHLAVLFPNIEFLGSDVNAEIIKSNLKANTLENVDYFVPKKDNSALFDFNTLVIFSSVMHEIFSFMSPLEITDLLSEVVNARAVAIRDMRFTPMSNDDNLRLELIPKESRMFKQFLESKHGEVSNELFLEFFLKREYLKNWEEELKESYFSVEWDKLDNVFNSLDFTKVYHKLYINNYLSEKIKEVKWLTNSTHYKVIYKTLL